MAYLAAMARTPLHSGKEDGATATDTQKGGCAVLVSIHQPRAAIWDMFDKARAAVQMCA
jgi:hypothetical protein